MRPDAGLQGWVAICEWLDYGTVKDMVLLMLSNVAQEDTTSGSDGTP